MRVLAHAGVQRISQVVAEIRGAVGETAGAKNGAGGWVGHCLVTLGELEDHWLGRVALQRRLANERRVTHRVAGLADPLRAVEILGNRQCPRHVVDHRGHVAQRHVLVEYQVAGRRHVRQRRQVDERRLPVGQRNGAEQTEHRAQAHDLDDRAARHVGHASLDG